MSDLYRRLGLSRSATPDEIKKSYRTLAREHHPDKGGNPEEFKAIQEAHEVLSDERRRQIYDMTGAVNEQPGHPGGGMGGMAAGGVPFNMFGGGPFGMPGGVNFDIGGMFNNIFGGGGGGPGGGRRRQGGRGPNKHHDVGLKLEQFYKGTEIKLNFNQGRRCEECHASGAEAVETCSQCQGAGSRMMMRQIGPGMMVQSQVACDACQGEGQRILKTCKGCKGKKFIEKEKNLFIKVTPGMREGEQLVFAGECSDSLEFDTPGDVVLMLRLATDGSKPKYEWRGEDLILHHSVTFAESILGFSVCLTDHPSGTAPTYTWKGGPVIHGAILTMPGGGMPTKSGGMGVLQMYICIQPPATQPWSEEVAKKLAEVLGVEPPPTAPEGSSPLVLGSANSVFGPNN